MATYYKWRKNNFSYTEERDSLGRTVTLRSGSFTYFDVYCGDSISIADNGDITILNEIKYTVSSSGKVVRPTGHYLRDGNSIYYTSGSFTINPQTYPAGTISASKTIYQVSSVVEVGAFVSYVYSTSSSAYPNGGVSGSYYYDQRTTIASPTAPNSITYPNSITNQAVSITFTESTSVIPDYSVDEYEISYNVNESSWVVAGTTKELSYSFNIPSVFTSNIMFRVRAKDTNGQWGDYKTGAIASVSLPALPPPTLTLPSSPVKINESFSISWTSISEATGYVLQKKKINDSDWSELYNGTLLSYTDTANDLGLRYRISYKVNEFQSEWSQEYSLNTFEKLIEISYLDEGGSYVPLYPVTSTVAVLNTSDLINLTLSTGIYQGNGFETNSIALENSVDPKIAIITNSKQETTLVTNFNENNMTVKYSNNELGETYNYVIIGNNKNK